MMFALAAFPTVIEPSSAKATTLAVMLSPYALGSTSTLPPRARATHELLVPRSIPMATSAISSLLAFDSPVAPAGTPGPHASDRSYIGRTRRRLNASRTRAARRSPARVLPPAHVWPLEMGDDQAQERRSRRQARQDLYQADPRDRDGGADRRRRSRGQSPAAACDGQGAGCEHAQGQYRARHQKRHGRRRRHPVRGG